METIKEKIKTLLKQVSIYVMIAVSFLVGISIGYYYDVVNYIMGVLNGTFIVGRKVSTS
jgi:hypothetical protein